MNPHTELMQGLPEFLLNWAKRTGFHDEERAAMRRWAFEVEALRQSAAAPTPEWAKMAVEAADKSMVYRAAPAQVVRDAQLAEAITLLRRILAAPSVSPAEVAALADATRFLAALPDMTDELETSKQPS
jgi:hypothetical protein